ncbi:MAG: hypothetical protein WA047_16790 [Phenylobacterium sp.]|uniref:hypothetical protein n=1 Tax=Phenylobacterium sp. TaxID=1871053 RepID=UPI003BB6EA17
MPLNRDIYETEEELRMAFDPDTDVKLGYKKSRANEIKEELSRLEARLTEVDAAQRASQEADVLHWTRRFHTSLALAHGAAFAAIGAHVFDPQTTGEVAALAWTPMAIFSLGLVLAGASPFALALRRSRYAWYLAGGSGLLFLIGIAASLAAIWIKADLVFPWQPHL